MRPPLSSRMNSRPTAALRLESGLAWGTSVSVMPHSCRDWAGASLVLPPFRPSFDLEIGQVLSAEHGTPSLPERSPGRGSRQCAEGDTSVTDCLCWERAWRPAVRHDMSL